MKRLSSRAALLLLAALPAGFSRSDPPNAVRQSLRSYVGEAPPDKLPPSSYVPFEAKRLANARVLWVNFEALRELGIRIPEGGLTPDFEAEILDLFAYMVPDVQDPPDAFRDGVRRFFADRYGGWGIASNGGSARAGVSGPTQVKNIGKTPVRGESSDFGHGHGGGSIKEAAQEAVWGEIFHAELPHKANRVLFVLDTGTYTVWPDGTRERRSLIVREDPLRPAQFIEAPRYAPPAGQVAEDVRVRNALERFAASLPEPRRPPNGSDAAARLAAGVDEMYERQVEQLAAAHAKRLFHGALSPSNIEVSGRFLDYASVTAMPGYVNHAADKNLASSLDEIGNLQKSYVELFQSIRNHSPRPEETRKLLLPDVMQRRLKNLYAQHLDAAYLEQLGFARRWMDATRHAPERRALGEALKELLARDATVGVRHGDDFARLKLRARFDALAKITLGGATPAELPEAVGRLVRELEIPEAQATRLTRSLRAYLAVVADHARSEGIQPDALRSSVLLRNAVATRDRSELYRETFKKRIVEMVDDYLATQDREVFRRYVDARVRENKRGFRPLKDFAVVLSEDNDPVGGGLRQVVFDEREAKLKTLVSAPIVDGEIRWHGHRIPESEANGLRLRAAPADWSSHQDIAPLRRGSSLLFEISLADDSTDALEYVLTNADQSRWWKQGEANFRVPLPDLKGLASSPPTSSCVDTLGRALASP